MSIDYEKIKNLISLVEENGLTELAVEEDGFSVTIKAESYAEPAHVANAPANPGVQVQAQPIEVIIGPLGESEAKPAHLVELLSPMIGVFYRKPSPDSPSFVEVGDEIEVGQTIGLIEAMKVFSEVPSEVAGHVVSIGAENGKLIQQGDILVVVDVSRV
ncbi:MAG: acetyl-CoA carboxylase biotin carboxyl carrier protein [Armatimonadetes bacterium]|nr:acetyl-CoA carboxylase biotin carboxyl carrier protein [Armatimonadota bacterium]